MVKKQKLQEMKDTSSRNPKYGYLALFVFSVFLIGGFGYFFKRDAILKNQMRLKNEKNILATLEKKDDEIRDLKRLVHQLENMPSAPSENESKSIMSLKKKISDNFQKILMQRKLERRLLVGKDFSLELHTLEALLKGQGKKPLENLRQYATEGIPSTFNIENHMKQDLGKSKTFQDRHTIFSGLLSRFFTVSRVDKKQDFDTLISYIRQDRMERALEFAEQTFPSKISWHKVLQKRFLVKKTLKAIEQAIIDSMKL